jgi:hypothetical protein
MKKKEKEKGNKINVFINKHLIKNKMFFAVHFIESFINKNN